MPHDVIIVTTTIDRRDVAERIAERLVVDSLAACVQIAGPLTSCYVWNDAFERGEEWSLQIKTRAARFDDVKRTIETLHPYEVPEILAVPVTAVSPRYAEWIRAQT